MEPVKRLIDSYVVVDMKQTQPTTIEIFYRVLSQELTRSMGVTIEIDHKTLSADPKKSTNGSKAPKYIKHLKHNPEKQES